jgi:hypothetical protein
MFLAYMDECGNTGTHADPNQPVHFLGCLLVEDTAIRPLEVAVRSVAKRHFPDHWLNPRFEFHGVDLFGGNGFFRGTSVDQRIDVTGELLSIAAEHAAGFGYVGLNKLKSKAKDHPHRICFSLLVERLEDWLRGKNALGLLVSDENHEIEQAIISDIDMFKRVATSWGYKSVTITRIVDSVHFVKSYNNPGIQLADIISFLTLKNERTHEKVWNAYIESQGLKQAIKWADWVDSNYTRAEKTTQELMSKLSGKTAFSKMWP